MRIFFVTNNYTPYCGGVVQSIQAIVNTLRAQGHEIFIITLTFLDNHADPEYVIRIPCPIKFKYKNNHMAIPWRAGKAMDALVRQYKPDIIHVHHPFLLGTYAVKIAHRYNIACFFTHHTFYGDYTHYIPLIGKYIKTLIQWYVKRFCIKIDAIIAPSSSVKDYLEAQQIRNLIQVIPSPLRECFTIDPQKKENQNTDFFELLLVTRFVREKNIPFIFEVIQQLPDNFRLTLIGYGYEYQKLYKLAHDELKISPARIRFIHKLETKDLIQQYRKAHLFIFPSQTDTQGIVLAESMSQGLPIIALDGPGQRDIIINEVNGFIVKNAQEMVEQIRMLAKNPLILEKMALAAHKTAYNYKAEDIVQKIMNMYSAYIHK